MSFEKYGNKLINLLSKIEHKLNPNAQIGGSDGPDTDPNNPNGAPYVKILSYSVKHVSVLVHLEKDGTVKELEDPQISYEISQASNQKVEEYSIEQQLRLGCDNKGNMYKYSVVLTRHQKKEAHASGATSNSDTETSNIGTALGKLSGALEGLKDAAVAPTS